MHDNIWFIYRSIFIQKLKNGGLIMETKELIFKNIENSNKCFKISNEYYKSNYNFPFSFNVNQYADYNDNCIQHGPEYSISEYQDIFNFYKSFNSHIFNQNNYFETLKDNLSLLYYLDKHTLDKSKIEFLFSLKYQEDKNTYYSIELLKKSSNIKLQYDKRYEKLDYTFKTDSIYDQILSILKLIKYYERITLINDLFLIIEYLKEKNIYVSMYSMQDIFNYVFNYDLNSMEFDDFKFYHNNIIEVINCVRKLNLIRNNTLNKFKRKLENE